MPLAHPINKAVENASPAMMVWALGITIADMAKRVDMRIYYLILAPTTYRDINIRSEIMEEPVMKSDATPGIRPFPYCSLATEAGSKSQIAGNTDSRTVADGEGFRDVDGRSRRGGAVIFRVKVDADVLPFDIVLHHPALIDPPSTRYTITKRTRPSSTRATLGAKRAGRTESAAKPAVGYH
jgi:hypothetical protein